MKDRLRKFLFPTEDDTFLKDTSLNDMNDDDDYEMDELPTNNNCIVHDMNETIIEPKKVVNTAQNLVFNPHSFKESEEIAQAMINGNIVIVNLENLLNDEQGSLNARRMIDFLCGVSFTIKGTVKRINDSTFIFQM